MRSSGGRFPFILGLLLMVMGGALWLIIHAGTPKSPVPKPNKQTAAGVAQMKLVEGNNAYRELRYRAAAMQYQALVDQFATSKDPAVIGEVAHARSNIAYCYARRGDFQSAAAHFQMVAEQYPHTLPVAEDAVLQHAICLKELGKKQQALSEFESLVAAKPSSTTFTNACQYIRRLNNGKLTPNAEATMARFQKEEEEAGRKKALERAMCGPKALAYVCDSIGIKTDYKEIAKLAGTNVNGTTMEDLAKAARLKGCDAAGLQVTLKGLRSQSKPLLALVNNHYLVIERARGKRVDFIDASGTEIKRFSIPADSLFEQWGGYVLRISFKGARNVKVHQT